MTKIKRKKLKKIPITIILIILILILTSITITINKKENKKTTKTKNELKLEKLNHIEKKLSYFNYNYIDRYIKYKNKNPNLTNKQVVTNVNIGLDYEYYTHTKKSTNLNKPTILVNKYNYLTEDYIPDNLENINIKYARSGMQLVNYAKNAFEKMAKAAEKDGYKIIAMSSYRSYKYQVNLYNRYKEKDGIKAADTYSARPGYSEHQTGLATDIYNGEIDFNNFEQTEEFNWMQQNAYKYGFILRFPKDKVKQTGYQYESWHYRYVGKDIAKYIHKNNLCLEEYYIQKIEKN